MSNGFVTYIGAIVSQKSFVLHLPLGRWDKTFLEIYIIQPVE
jgi:hypothetical protein